MYIGLCTEFPEHIYYSKTKTLAIRGVEKMVKDSIEEIQKNKNTIPEPLSSKDYSGKLIIRIPPEVHRRLAIKTKEQKVSLNRYISSKLSKAHHI